MSSPDHREITVGDTETDASEFAWSPDGRQVAVLGSLVRKVTVFEVATGRAAGVLDGLAGGAKSVAFLPDGRIICGPRGAIASAASIWEPGGGEPVLLSGANGGAGGTNENMLSLFSFDPHSYRLVGIFRKMAGDRAVIYLAVYDMRERKLLASAEMPASKVAIAPGGGMAAIVGQSGQVDLVDLGSGRIVNHIDANRNPVEQLAWSPDGRWLLTGASPEGYGLDRTTEKYGPLHDSSLLQVWDAKTGQKIATAPNIASAVRAIDVSSDGRRVAVALAEGTVRILKLHDLSELSRIAGDGKPVDLRAKFSPDGARLGVLKPRTRSLSVVELAPHSAGAASH